MHSKSHIVGFLEYIYYRIAKHYYKRDGRDAAGAIIIISVMQAMLMADLLNFIIKLFIPLSVSADYVKYGRIIGIAVLFLFMILNYFYFRGKYWALSEYWKERENARQTEVRGWLVVLAIFSPFIVFFLM